jgi:hypothetical protein
MKVGKDTYRLNPEIEKIKCEDDMTTTGEIIYDRKFKQRRG